jgi:hypothetical protein
VTRQELRVYLKSWFCGCGNLEDAAATLLRLLRLHPLYHGWGELAAWIPDDGVRYLLLYALDRDELTEHGYVVTGAWLTEKGEAVKAALEAEEPDGFLDLFEQSCVHGFDITDTDHDCMAADA